MNRWQLPQSASIGGREYAINADYRDILDIINHLNDLEHDEGTRLYVSMALFYNDFDQMTEMDYEEAINWMMCFINCGEEENNARPRPKVIDWDKDAGMIIADVNKVAGGEVRALHFCHWWTFMSWFNGIGEGQLSTVVSIREKRRKGKKLDDWERQFYQEHKDMVDLKQKYTAEEIAEQERLKRLLGE